jgi:hypothetical protein
MTRYPRSKYVVGGLLVALLAMAVGHLYLLDGLTELYLGLPAWIWVELVVVAVMLGVAWVTVQVFAKTVDLPTDR